MSDGGILSNVPEGFEARMQRRAALTTADLNHIIETLPAQLATKMADGIAEHESRHRGQEVMGGIEATVGQYKEIASQAAQETAKTTLQQWPLPETRKQLVERLEASSVSRAFSRVLEEKGVPAEYISFLQKEFIVALAPHLKAIEEAGSKKGSSFGTPG